MTETESERSEAAGAALIGRTGQNLPPANVMPGITVTESDGSTAVVEGGASDTFTIVLDSQPSDPVFIQVVTDGQVDASTFSVDFDSTNWDTPQTVTVFAVDDIDDEGAHAGTISLFVTSNDSNYNFFPVDDINVNIEDNDDGNAVDPDPRINEIHYSNVGSDSGEFVEVRVNAGANVGNLFLDLIDGATGNAYDFAGLSTLAMTTDGTYDYYVWTPTTIEDGTPDGIALSDGSGTVIEFLSYGGSFVGAGFPITGVSSTDIAVVQSGAEVAGSSIQRSDDGATWTVTDGSNTAGAANAVGDTTAPTVTGTSPADDATGVSVDANLTLTFDEDVAKGTGNITIHLASDDSVVETVDITGSAVSVSGATVTINPATTLAASTEYYVQIASGAIEDTSGNDFSGIADTTSFSFTTANPPVLGPVRINEFHYRNAGTDQNEFLEIRAVAGTDVTGYGVDTLGSDSQIIDFNLLTSMDKTTDGAFDYYVWEPLGGLGDGQLGIALSTGNSDDVVLYDFISYGGAFTGTDFPVNGATSSDVGVTEPETQPVGSSIQRTDDGTSWIVTSGTNTAGAANAVGSDTTAPTLASTTPADDATQVAAGANFVLTFDEAVQAGSGSITIHLTSNNSVVETIDVTSGAVSIVGTDVTINPAADLIGSTAYHVQVDSGAFEDLAGNAFAGISGMTDFNFTTAPDGPTEGNDVLVLTGNGDAIDSLGGNDIVRGLGGDDSIEAGAGNDTVNGGAGNDTLSGSSGDNVLRGEGGNDSITSGSGNDLLTGGNGNDSVDGGSGNDTLLGQGSDDMLFGGVGEDFLSGGIGDDTMWGGADNDQILGQGNADVLYGDDGEDSLAGGAGDDILYGGDDDDQLNGQGNNDVLYGGGGNDFLRGAAGSDSLYGGVGNDQLFGGGGRDLLDGGKGDDLLNAGAQIDRFMFGTGSENDEIRGFADNQDTLEIEYALVSSLGAQGTFGASEVLTAFSSEAGGAVLFDFQNASEFLRITAMTQAQLQDDLIIV